MTKNVTDAVNAARQSLTKRAYHWSIGFIEEAGDFDCEWKVPRLTVNDLGYSLSGLLTKEEAIEVLRRVADVLEKSLMRGSPEGERSS